MPKHEPKSKYSVDVTFYDGKYRIAQRHGGGMEFWRHGEPWPAAKDTYEHSGMVLAAIQEIAALREQLNPTNKNAADGRSPSVVISDWLRLMLAGQWTPQEAASRILVELRKAGYAVSLNEDTPPPNKDLPKLLRAIAGGTDAKKARHDIVLNAAAHELEYWRRVGLYRQGRA